MSSFDGLISTAFKQLFNDAIDEILSTTGLTVKCTIVYAGSKSTECPNCLYSPATGKSSGKYKTGGPISFTTGICPYCHGQGRTIDEQTEDFYFGVIWDSKQFIGKAGVNNTNNEYVQTISKLSTFDNIKKANYILIDTANEAYSRNKFQRVNEPYFAGFNDGDYIFTLWKRIE